MRVRYLCTDTDCTMVIDKQVYVERTEAIQTEISVAEEAKEGMIFSYIRVRSS